MNSEMNSYIWILTYDFTICFMIMNSYFMNSYLNSYYEQELMIMNLYATCHDLWIHIWIHVYEEYPEIIPEIMCTKVPDDSNTSVYLDCYITFDNVTMLHSTPHWQSGGWGLENHNPHRRPLFKSIFHNSRKNSGQELLELGNALCLCSPVRPAHAVPECGPKSLAIDIAVKSFDCLLE